MADPYITKLKKENEALKAYVKADISWEAAMRHAETTSRKADAYKEADALKKVKDAAFAAVSALLTE